MYIHTVGILGSGVQHLLVFRACGPVRGPGVVREGEILIRKDCVSKYRLALTIMAQEGELRIYASSARHCWGPKVVSIDRGMFQEISLVLISIVEMSDKEVSKNIWGKSCYLRIKCIAVNSLAVLMWRWCLNSGNQPYSDTMRTEKKYRWDKY